MKTPSTSEERVIAVVQARMASRRLPGKVMLPLAGQPVISHVVRRADKIRSAQQTVVATTSRPEDDEIASWCDENGVALYRGSDVDVLGRFCETADSFGADAVVRITADCPLLDPAISDRIVSSFSNGNWALASLSGSFPDGLDTAVFSVVALREANSRAKLRSEREHIGPFFESRPDEFPHNRVFLFESAGNYRLTLDEEDDYLLLSRIFDELGSTAYDAAVVMQYLDQNPQLRRLNTHIERNEGLRISLEQDFEHSRIPPKPTLDSL